MVNRKKTKLEKFFSLNQHLRRLGGNKATCSLYLESFCSLKEKIIEGDSSNYTYGSYKNLDQQFDYLKQEFVGNSELLFFHAKLIVLIRRSISLNKNYTIFNNLWKHESKFLLKNLDLRWLIAAADTFSDCSNDPLERALAFNASCLINTVKIIESERYLQSLEKQEDAEERQKILDEEKRVSLFDGLCVFKSGTDDTLRNMRWRLDSISKLHPTGKILLECFERLQVNDNVYFRFKERHRRSKTQWW